MSHFSGDQVDLADLLSRLFESVAENTIVYAEWAIRDAVFVIFCDFSDPWIKVQGSKSDFIFFLVEDKHEDLSFHKGEIILL